MRYDLDVKISSRRSFGFSTLACKRNLRKSSIVLTLAMSRKVGTLAEDFTSIVTAVKLYGVVQGCRGRQPPHGGELGWRQPTSEMRCFCKMCSATN